MRKLVIAATVLSFLMTVAGVVLWFTMWPKMLRQNAAVLAFVVEEGLAEYHKEIGQFPEGNGAQVIAALLGENPREKSYLRSEFRSFLTDQGELKDPWRRLYRFESQTDGGFKLRSAGKNGIFDDDDDVTSATVTQA